jgi:UDP-N-acetylmuramate--alanine ligase
MKKVHLIGIGGIGMSALARYFLSEDIRVTGTDTGINNPLLAELKKEGAVIYNEHLAENITDDTDLIIYSEAISEDNPERKVQILQMSYFQYLGELSKQYKTIAIAGTHGKSTTTAMCALAMPHTTCFVGTKIFEWNNKNFRKGDSAYLLMESCEYRNSFLNITPHIAVITSLEHDHLDFFENEEVYFKSFEKFISKAQILVADFNDENILKISKNFKGQKINTSLLMDDVPPIKIQGEHNVENASKVLGIFKALDRDIMDAKDSLQEFQGTWRRMEQRSEHIYDDYAHHPTEIKATLKALREKYPVQKIFCVFQPHQYSRTKFFLDEFAESFDDADEVLIPNIYRSRDTEEDIKSISEQELAEKIGEKARHTFNFENTVKMLKEEITEEDIVITMGAGDVYLIADELVKIKR